MATVGAGYGYSVQPVIENIYNLGTSSITINGSAAASSSQNYVRIWTLWLKDVI